VGVLLNNQSERFIFAKIPSWPIPPPNVGVAHAPTPKGIKSFPAKAGITIKLSLKRY